MPAYIVRVEAVEIDADDAVLLDFGEVVFGDRVVVGSRHACGRRVRLRSWKLRLDVAAEGIRSRMVLMLRFASGFGREMCRKGKNKRPTTGVGDEES